MSYNSDSEDDFEDQIICLTATKAASLVEAKYKKKNKMPLKYHVNPYLTGRKLKGRFNSDVILFS